MSDAVQGREVARRLFAAEFDDATLSYSEGDDERAPNYVVTPTGARVNRLFAVGALTEVEQVNEEIVRGRVADPTGAFVTYAGQYQPDAMGFLDRATPPCMVSLTGKARTYQPDDSERIFTSVRPESLNEVDADTRDRWVIAAAEATLDRVATMAAAVKLDVRGDDLTAALEARGVESALAQGVALAVDHYEPTEHYLEGIRQTAVQALELVAGEREAVDAPTAAPDEEGPRTLGSLPDVAAAAAAPDNAAAVPTEPSGDSDSEVGSGDDSESGSSAEPETDPTAEPEAEPTTASEDAAPVTDDAEESGTLGDFSPENGDEIDGGDEADTEADAEEDLEADVDSDEMYELDEEERAEIEAEYGTEFSTGNEVDDPGEADIDVPDVDELEDKVDEEAGSGSSEEASSADADEPSDSDEGETDEAPADVDLEDAAVSVMADLDDGDGADREAVVAAVVEEYGADPDDVDEAIREALMGGKCYEPAEGTLKSI
ncbi:RPA family protein [Halobellus salinisoli]|uniref:RPA family protein n=1 Tax=Halobellus salinisoli TaxID=3108500 RepID=UPI00300AFE66